MKLEKLMVVFYCLDYRSTDNGFHHHHLIELVLSNDHSLSESANTNNLMFSKLLTLLYNNTYH